MIGWLVFTGQHHQFGVMRTIQGKVGRSRLVPIQKLSEEMAETSYLSSVRALVVNFIQM